VRKLNLEKAVERIIEFIGKKTKEANAEGVVIGISGGIDSATTAYLAVKALGKNRVFGLVMPYYSNGDIKDARFVCSSLGIKFREIQIKEIVDSFRDTVGINLDKKSLGNVMARTRMILLYTYANSQNLLVLGTSNRSEFLTGYFTKWGDGASDYAPIINLYKTEVWKIARLIGVPGKIIKKKPSAGLWKGQTDERELGISYSLLDEILYQLVDLKWSRENVAKNLNVPIKIVEHVENLVKRSEHKRRLPLGPTFDDLL